MNTMEWRERIHRANFELRDGKLLVCWNDHDKGQPCEWEVLLSGPDIDELCKSSRDAGARAERDACIRIMQSYKVLAGNSPAGEMAAEWTLDALLEVADELKARGKHESTTKR